MRIYVYIFVYTERIYKRIYVYMRIYGSSGKLMLLLSPSNKVKTIYKSGTEGDELPHILPTPSRPKR